MNALSPSNFRCWAKSSDSLVAKLVRGFFYGMRGVDVPAPPYLWRLIYLMHKSVLGVFQNIVRIFYWTPLFKSQISDVGKSLYLFGGLPYLAGPLVVTIGDNCRVSGHITITGRTAAKVKPKLIVGDNVDVGWMTTIAVGSTISIGNNVKIAGQCFLAGYPGHPLDAKSRAQGKPELDVQAGEIIVEDDVWLATGTSVMPGVVIGEGCIVAAQSVVTHSLPPYVLAAGSPAKIIRHLDRGDQ